MRISQHKILLGFSLQNRSKYGKDQFGVHFQNTDIKLKFYKFNINFIISVLNFAGG